MSDSETAEAKRKSHLRWITLGEAIAIAALIVSAFGVWISWKGDDAKTTTIVEKRQSIPLALRGKAQDDGRSLVIAPVEPNHALQSLVLTPQGGKAVDVGSDGELSANALSAALGNVEGEQKGTQPVRVKIAARYVEAGADKSANGSYVITYRWEGGGLFGGRSLRISGFSRG